MHNPSAFPGGMTRRDWFAGQALTGLLASGKWDNVGPGFDDFIAVRAGNIADAMLAAQPEENSRAE